MTGWLLIILAVSGLFIGLIILGVIHFLDDLKNDRQNK
jgi:hypothetical protein